METWKKEGDTLTLSLPVKKYNKSNNTFYKDDNVVFYVDFKNGDFNLSNEEGGLQACLESTGERIGDIFNEWHGASQYAKSLLMDSGWVFSTPTRVNRPGNGKGHGATFGVVGEGCLYVWSSNAYPFEDHMTYSPFSLLAMLECGGDWGKAVLRAKEIIG